MMANFRLKFGGISFEIYIEVYILRMVTGIEVVKQILLLHVIGTEFLRDIVQTSCFLLCENF